MAEITIVGGLGHVGLPLSLKLAEVGNQIYIYDIDKEAVTLFENNKAKFVEEGIEDFIKKNKSNIEFVNHICTEIVILATNIDDLEYLFSNISALNYSKYLFIRQTLKPYTITKSFIKNFDSEVIYVPERLAQGFALKEINIIPQLVGCANFEQFNLASSIFNWVNCIPLTYIEAEFAKIFCNYYRYGTFALANDMFRICQLDNVNFNKIRKAITYEYPRMFNFPKAGFSGGYCLPKDTEHLIFNSELAEEVKNANWYIVLWLRDLISSRIAEGLTVGILGVTAKSDVDDLRYSVYTEVIQKISFKIPKGFLKYYDFFVKSDPIEEVLNSDVLIIAIPHSRYKDILKNIKNKEIIDPWGIL